MEKSDLEQKLTAYISHLDETVDRLRRSEFPFTDAAMVYEEVARQLKTFVET